MLTAVRDVCGSGVIRPFLSDDRARASFFRKTESSVWVADGILNQELLLALVSAEVVSPVSESTISRLLGVESENKI